jgi:RNA recognition motif-containing protein
VQSSVVVAQISCFSLVFFLRFLKGLDIHSDENSILAVLSRYSTGIRQVRIMRERGSNLSRGFCFVDFVSVEAATTMLKGCLAIEIDGRTVKMSYAKPKDSMNLVFGGKQADESLTMHARDVAQKAIAGVVAHTSLIFVAVSLVMACNNARTSICTVCSRACLT